MLTRTKCLGNKKSFKPTNEGSFSGVEVCATQCKSKMEADMRVSHHGMWPGPTPLKVSLPSELKSESSCRVSGLGHTGGAPLQLHLVGCLQFTISPIETIKSGH